MQTLKVVVVGDKGVGKTSLIATYTNNKYPAEYVPILGKREKAVLYKGNPIKLEIWDVPGGLEFDEFRQRKIYQNVDVFIICFAVSNPDSLEEVWMYWKPEIYRSCPKIPFIVCATKTDLRKSEQVKIRLRLKGREMPSPEMGIAVAKSVHPFAYVECSAYTNTGLSSVFEAAIQAKFSPVRKRKTLKTSLTHMLISVFKSHKKMPVGPDMLQYHHTPPIEPVYGHKACVVGERTYIIGGCNEKGEFYTHVKCFDSKKNEWKVLDNTEMPPQKFHTCVEYQNSIFIFGGKHNGSQNACYKYNTQKGSLTRIEPKMSVPTPRHGHTAVVYKEKMYIFGGRDDMGSYNDMHTLHFDTSVWEEVKTIGVCPSARFMHSAVIENEKMYIFGGQSDDSILDDLFSFDFATSTWTKLKARGNTISARAGHTAVATPSGIFVYGGYGKINETKYYSNIFSLDTFSLEWFHPNYILGIDSLPSLAHHSCVLDHYSHSLFIVGGKGGSKIYSESFMIKMLKTIDDILPASIFIDIMSMLTIVEFENIRSTCKKIRDICEDERIWKFYGESLIPSFLNNDLSEFKTYKEKFYYMYFNPVMTISVPEWK